jgi:hypothetical protein
MPTIERCGCLRRQRVVGESFLGLSECGHVVDARRTHNTPSELPPSRMTAFRVGGASNPSGTRRHADPGAEASSSMEMRATPAWLSIAWLSIAWLIIAMRGNHVSEEARLLDTRPRHTPTRPPKHPRTTAQPWHRSRESAEVAAEIIFTASSPRPVAADGSPTRLHCKAAQRDATPCAKLARPFCCAPRTAREK